MQVNNDLFGLQLLHEMPAQFQRGAPRENHPPVVLNAQNIIADIDRQMEAFRIRQNLLLAHEPNPCLSQTRMDQGLLNV